MAFSRVALEQYANTSYVTADYWLALRRRRQPHRRAYVGECYATLCNTVASDACHVITMARGYVTRLMAAITPSLKAMTLRLRHMAMARYSALHAAGCYHYTLATLIHTLRYTLRRT